MVMKDKQLSEREKEHERKKRELAEQENDMMEKYEQLKINLERMSKNQLNMMKIQELRQKQHKLDMEEAKLNMINASHQAVSLVDTMTKQKGAAAPEEDPTSLQNIDMLKMSIKQAKQNLANEEVNLKDSIQTFEKSLDMSMKNSRDSRFASGDLREAR